MANVYLFIRLKPMTVNMVDNALWGAIPNSVVSVQGVIGGALYI